MKAANPLSPLRFVLTFGLVSCLADFVYEGARAIVGPFLATMGASALVVGFVTGFGEAVALVLRLGTGRLSDRTGRHWALSITVYVITMVAVPLLALAQTLWQAALLVVAERFGKAVRTPARDTMLAQASSRTGRGRAFAVHEALDQSGAVIGPLVVAAMVAVSGYRLGFGVLVVPGVAAVALLVWLRRTVPNPGAYEDWPSHTVAAPADQGFSRRFWVYTAFTAMTMLGYATFGARRRRRHGPRRPPWSRLRHLHRGLRPRLAGRWHDPGRPLRPLHPRSDHLHGDHPGATCVVGGVPISSRCIGPRSSPGFSSCSAGRWRSCSHA
ncbi:MAG TPA: MFS transporter [Mycobacterium sp.]|nr:MFS transporter [Mycobacterium sp.]